jgi:CubicO group peptidase (beta-lactamase class C family)
MLRSTTFAGITLQFLTPAFAQDRAAEIDAIFAFVAATDPGCVVGVARAGHPVFSRAYGLADVERAVPLTPNTKFDIGSTHKQFVAAAVLLLVEQGALTLADDVRKHLPELPDYGHTIEIDHLLTHTSGVRDWAGLLPLAEPGTDALALVLRQRGLDFVPGERWDYSNSGYVLLKEIVARVSGVSFAEFLHRRVFEPLGMKSSEYVTDILQGSGERAIGYERDGARWRQFMRLGNRRGGGGVISTAGDLLLWNEALTSRRLGAFVGTELEEPAVLRNGRRLSYARGLIVHEDASGRIVSHSGAAAGYSTWLGRSPGHGLSVVVLCNFEPVSATSLAGKVADLFLPPAAESAPAEPELPVTEDLTRRGGLYLDESTHEPLRLLARDGRLSIASGPALVPVGEGAFGPQRPTLWFRSEDAFRLTFTSADTFDLTSMEGEVARFRRAAPPTTTAAGLEALGGRYASGDLGVVWEVTPTAKGLALRFEHAPERSLDVEPVAEDTFMLRLMTVRFRRDAKGEVVGFDYSNPGVRCLPFTRLGDRAAQAK